MANDLHWKRSYTGFYVDNRMHSISNNIEFLRFPLLGSLSKLRLAWTLLYASRIDDWRKLEKISVADWLIRVSGAATYEKLWQPLLLAKLGDNYERVSAVFIWAYIKRLFSARHSSASKEKLGYVAGGYKVVLEQVRKQIEQRGGAVKTGVAVRSIAPGIEGGIVVATDTGEELFDRVVCTSPVPVLQKIAAPSLLDVTGGRGPIEYLGVICVVVVSENPITPYYVINIADRSIPFTGVIGMTSVVSTRQTAGFHLTYLPKYMLPSDSMFRQTDEQIKSEFIEGLRKMFPEFDINGIESVHVNRAERVQPLQVLDYSTLVPTVRTRHPDFFVLNTAQFVDGTLNNNEVIGCVERFADEWGERLARRTAAAN
jgi:protoporphyrinogen oxidase